MRALFIKKNLCFYIALISFFFSPLTFAHLETERTDISEAVRKQLPFLKPDIRFWDVFPPGPADQGNPHLLYAELPNHTQVGLFSYSQFADFVQEIKAPEDALRYVRFLSDPGIESGPLPFFRDVPFRELAPKIDLNRQGFVIRISAATLEKFKVKDPVVIAKQNGGGKQFVIERYVFPVNEIRTLEISVRDGAIPLKISHIAKLKETVDSKGRYQYKMKLIPAQDFEIQYAGPSLEPYRQVN